ncbi:MAG: tetratricopeptide repeat protein [Bacteroidota bacterium]
MKTTKLFWIIVLAAFAPTAYGQDLHNGAEILQILNDSEISYIIDLTKEDFPAPDQSNNLLFNNFYRPDPENPSSITRYQVSEEGQASLEKAEKAFEAREYDKARDFYIEVLKTDPEYYKMMTYIGQTFGIERKWDDAANWYQQALEANPIDYMTHWFLGDVYAVQGDYDTALRLAITGHILNRNNPRILASVEKILNEQKRKYLDINAYPQVQIDSVGPKEVNIRFQEAWLGYALTKAVWDFEPGYAEDMGSGRTQESILEEKECLINLLNGASKKALRKDEGIRLANEAVQAGYAEAYILYELLLPQYPHVALQLPKENMDVLYEYVIRFRIR